MPKKHYTIHTPETLRARCMEEGDCLIWQGYYGNRTPMVMHNGLFMPVRRLFTLLLKGESRPGFYSPTCGNSGCVEPAHTVWRSHSQHAKSMVKRANASASTQMIRRAKISATKRKISDQALHDIMNTNASGPVLAERHGISRTLVSRYRRGMTGQNLANNPFAGLY
jgi:hypothetical protein